MTNETTPTAATAPTTPTPTVVAPPASLQFLQQFRQKLIGLFPRRADALFELVDALLLTCDPRSPVELSTSPAFRRRYSMVYDALQEGAVDEVRARQLLAEVEPAEAVTLEGYQVHATDSTPQERADAPTLADRGHVYSTCKEGTVVGQQHNWLGRIVAQGQSWLAPRDVERIPTASTPCAVAAQQVLRLAAALAVGVLAVVVADSSYAKTAFLLAFVGLPNLFVLVRLAQNRVLYGPPPTPELNPLTGKRLKRGHPKVHGAKFKLKAPPAPEQQVTFTLKGFTVQASAWGQLHFKPVPKLVGMVLRIEFFKPDGTPKYKRPLWLFWSGPTTCSLEALCHMYLLRSGMEHFFRFLKQALGVHCAQSTNPTVQCNWCWTVIWAYVHLMLARAVVAVQPRPWDPKARRDPQHPLTPGQVLHGWPIFSRELDTPAQPPRPSGKGTGREAGEHPTPRPTYPIVTKKQKTAAA